MSKKARVAGPPLPPRNRQVVESERFGKERAEVASDWKRFDEALEATYWALSRDPALAGIQVPGRGLWVLPLYSWSEDLGLVIYYTFDADQVTLQSVRHEIPDAEDIPF